MSCDVARDITDSDGAVRQNRCVNMANQYLSVFCLQDFRGCWWPVGLLDLIQTYGHWSDGALTEWSCGLVGLQSRFVRLLEVQSYGFWKLVLNSDKLYCVYI
jgi:hypothetical protein